MIYKYTPGQFAGMSLEAADQLGLEIVNRAALSGAWRDAIEPLVELRSTMHQSQWMIDQQMERFRQAVAMCSAEGLRLDRTNWNHQGVARYQLRDGKGNIVAGASFSLTIEDVEAHVAALK